MEIENMRRRGEGGMGAGRGEREGGRQRDCLPD